MFFIPQLYVHLAKDFIKVRSEFETEIVNHIANKVVSEAIFSREDFLKAFINSKGVKNL